MGEPENGLDEGQSGNASDVSEGSGKNAETVEPSELPAALTGPPEEPAEAVAAADELSLAPVEPPAAQAEPPDQPVDSAPAPVEPPAVPPEPPPPPETAPVPKPVLSPAQTPEFGLLIRLRAAGPWRYGGDSGDRERMGTQYHSDSLYSAVTLAMLRLGKLDEWLQATALAPGRPDVRFTSLFPWQGDTLYVTPPRSIWPPLSSKVRAKGASFIPLSLVSSLLAGTPFDEDHWTVDGESRCLLFTPSKSQPVGPFRQATRSFAAVDRLNQGQVAPHRASCIEFSPASGFWCFTAFENADAQAKWGASVEGAFRLLADSGIGGRRSIGWGRAFVEEIRTCSLHDLLPVTAEQLVPEEGVPTAPAQASETSPYWLLSVFSPAEEEQVDWRQGSYALISRGGRVDSNQGAGSTKKLIRLVEEGSVLFAGSPPNGKAADVAPDGFPHPVFRYGYAVTVRIPERLAP